MLLRWVVLLPFAAQLYKGLQKTRLCERMKERKKEKERVLEILYKDDGKS